MILHCCLCYALKMILVSISMVRMYYWSGVKRIHLLLIQRIIVGLPVKSYPLPVTVHNTGIEQVSSYKYLGLHVDAALSWSAHIDYNCSKLQQRIYFLRRLRSIGSNKQILLLFFQSIITEYYAVWNQCMVQLSLCSA